jgi:flagellar biogenesis protein FliO
MPFLNSTFLLAVAEPLTSTDFLGEPLLWVRVVAVLGMMGAGAYLLTNYTRKKRVSSSLSGEGKIVVADTCSLGNKQFLVVAQYGSEKHLIGVSSTSISYLSRLASGVQDFQGKLDQVESKSEDDQVV